MVCQGSAGTPHRTRLFGGDISVNDVSTLLHTDERAAYAQTASCRGTWDNLAKGQVEHRIMVLKQKPDASARHFSSDLHAHVQC